jgi:pimeloyl-ACP methyl ester carboxylesterase
MTKHLFNFFFAVCMSLAIYGCTTHEWEPKDMHSRIKGSLKADLKPNAQYGSRSFDDFKRICGFVKECDFDLHYFFGDNYVENDKKRKNILFVPGGPGDIVDRKNAFLGSASFGANLIYFDVRGSGHSTIPPSNEYDQFLRAQYVVEDIEALRKKLFNECSIGENQQETKCQTNVTPWDAIYAHSWGTIVAQRYAFEYPDMVRKLILSAPVSRGHGKTESSRRAMIVKNLLDLYEKQRSTGCPWPSDDELVTGVIMDNRFPSKMDTFCFVDKTQMDLIERNLTSLLYNLQQDYGSSTFVSSYYDELRKQVEFRRRYPYPRELFNAIRQLETLGSAEQDSLRFDSATRNLKFSAALVLGYFMTFDIKNPTRASGIDSESFSCDVGTEFLKNLPPPRQNHLRENFCSRIKAGYEALNSPSSEDQSKRARLVFGIYDGLARWIFEMLDQKQRLDKDGCFTGKELQEIATGDIQTNPTMQNEAKKIGVRGNERICPWDPALFQHSKETLVLKGKSDAVIAGCQAEYFFNEGLKPGKRVLIEFPGAGHSMRLQLKVPEEKEEVTQSQIEDMLAFIVYLFLDRSLDEFGKNVNSDLMELGARLVTGAADGCGNS